MPRTKHPTKANTKLMAVNGELEKAMQNLASVASLRNRMAQGLGKSYDGQRDIYQALGYKKTLCYDDYFNKYTRQDISRRIVNAFPEATWRGRPTVQETEDPEDTAFEEAWEELVKDKNVLHYLTRADKLAGVGRYSVLLLGFNDGEDLNKEVVPSENMELLYLTPYSEKNAEVYTWVADTKSERYGLPETYKLRLKNLNVPAGTKTESSSITNDAIVHYSRIIHIAEGLMESEVYGTPRLECVYNRLEDLERVVGGSSEMFWRGGFPGLSLEMDPEAELSPQALEDLDEQVDDYVHSLRRYMKLQGIKANSLAPQVVDPEKNVDTELKLVSGATGIPVRILTGSEMGQLASTQDKENWTDRIGERRNDFAEPVVLRPLLDTLIMVGVLPEPPEGYTVVWPDIDALSDKELAEIGLTRSKALGEYVKSGAEMIVPPLKFFTDFLGMPEDQATSILEEMIDVLNDERLDMIEADETNNQPPPPPPGVDEEIIEEDGQ